MDNFDWYTPYKFDAAAYEFEARRERERYRKSVGAPLICTGWGQSYWMSYVVLPSIPT